MRLKLTMPGSQVRLIVHLIWISAFIAGIEVWIGWRELLWSWRSLAPGPLFLAVSALIVSYFVRALRLYSYFGAEIRGAYPVCVKLIFQHNFYNNILPMRSGELSFPILLFRYFNITMARSLPTLMWFRLLDLHTILSLGGVFLIQPNQWNSMMLPIVLLWAVLPWFFFRVSKQARDYLGKKEERAVKKWVEKGLSSLPSTASEFWLSWGWTWVSWIIKLLALTFVFRLFIQAPFSAAWLGVIAGDLTSVLPLHSVAGIGTYEAGIVAAVLPFGVEPKDAVQGAINLHFFFIATTFLTYILAQFIRPVSITRSEKYDQ